MESDKRTIHFIAGLPRAGSTLLSAILRQNSRFNARMSSPVEHIYAGAVRSMSAENYFARFLTNSQKERILKNIFDAYYAEIERDVIFDTNRNWPAHLPGLKQLFPNFKMICCVRSIVAILNDFEYLVRRNPFEISKLFDFDPNATVYGRSERLLNAKGPVGRAFNALREGYYGAESNHLIFVEYRTLAESPKKILDMIYKTIGEPPFEHDFEHLEYDEPEFDSNLGLSGMHRVESMVRYQPRQLILPRDLVEKYKNSEFWRTSAKKSFTAFDKSLDDL